MSTDHPADTVVEARALHFRAGASHILRGVDLTVRRGEVVALLGANGAGKSTLMKILSGNYTRDEGSITVDGRPAEMRDPADALDLGIRLLPQELSVYPDLTVAENIMMGVMPRKRVGPLVTIDRARMERQAGALLARMGLDWLSPARRMGDLSHHVQRIVEIARALAGNARVLIMDEPTAALADAEVRLLFEIIGRLKADGIAIVYISHYLNEVFEVADRIVVLRDGRNAGEFITARTDVDAVLEAIVGNRVGDIYPGFAKGEGGETMVEVEGLSLPGWLDGIDFDLQRGRITGMHGLIGSGAEMAGRALFGAEPKAQARRIVLDGEDYRIAHPGQAVEKGLGLLAAERKREGIISMLSLRENMSVTRIKMFAKGPVVDVGAERAAVGDWIKRLSIRARDAEQPIGTLSGGNQQKVCLARWLMGHLKVLILEEPTRGVDMGARQEIYRQIRDLADQGLAILLISSDAEEVAGLADRSIVLAHGRITQTFEQPVAAAKLMSAASEPVAA